MSSVIQQPRDQKPRLVTEIPGPRSRELRAREDATIAPGLQGFALLAGIAVREASGSTVTDEDGNVFLDLIGGIGVNGLGHSHPRFVAALAEQATRASIGSFTSEPRVRLLEYLARQAGRLGLGRSQLYSSGAEAVESALRLAKASNGKSEFVAFWGGFHGKTLGALSLIGSDFKHGMGPVAPGSHLIPFANCYRCPVSLKYPSCGLACLELGRRQLKAASTGRVAAVLVEPMQGTAGNVIPPPEFIRGVGELAKELGALLIVDEMITGFGRTGRYWGSEHSGVVPDVVTVGKQMGGGFPISGVISRDSIVRAEPWSRPSGSSSSYGGNPLAAAAAAATLETIDDEGLVENSRRVGARMLVGLQRLQEKFEAFGDVRGSGLFLGIELVRDRATREPISSRAAAWVFGECLRRGLLTMAYSASFRLQPAMTIDEATADTALGILEEVFELFTYERIADRAS